MNECRLLKPPHFYSWKKLNLLISAKFLWVFLSSSVGKESTGNSEDARQAVQPLGWKDPLEEEMATHSSIFCLENYMDRGAQWATVQRVTKRQIGTERLSTYTHTQSFYKVKKPWVEKNPEIWDHCLLCWEESWRH